MQDMMSAFWEFFSKLHTLDLRKLGSTKDRRDDLLGDIES